ncbi:sigma-70 family RNA polymerase sigma factor [Thermopolyspora sp. NPDC052614]|uniref:RNA polymerase sigma factor n=1 Tax=Thermopolyspora sp. NPDC052614 TaxID=3155682 RepID=UPI0034437784
MSDEQPGSRWTDAELVRAAAHPRCPGERDAALGEIWNRHHRRVTAFCAHRLDDIHDTEDVVAQTFIVAFTQLVKGRAPNDPGRLLPWLYGIARNRCRQEWRRRRRVGPMPEYETEDEDAEYERASRARQVEVDRMMAIVKMTLTDNQRRIHELSVEQHLRGVGLAKRLGVGAAEAARLAYENQSRLVKGFGALVLARDGGEHCPALAKILRDHGWDDTRQRFTAALRQRIIRHFDDCPICDNCQTCAKQRKLLIAPYVPVLIPPLLGADLYERVIAGLPDDGETDDKTDPPDETRDGGGNDDEDDGGAGGGDATEGERPPAARGGRRARNAAAALMALAVLVVLLVAGAGAAALGVLPGFQRVALRITVRTAVAAVTDIPGDPAGPCTVDIGNLSTDCTKILYVPKGERTPVTVVPEAGSAITLRYFGCDDRSPSGAPSCELTPVDGRVICITTSDPRDLPNAAECRRLTT